MLCLLYFAGTEYNSALTLRKSARSGFVCFTLRAQNAILRYRCVDLRDRVNSVLMFVQI